MVDFPIFPTTLKSRFKNLFQGFFKNHMSMKTTYIEQQLIHFQEWLKRTGNTEVC